jgi:hypothetical protein
MADGLAPALDARRLDRDTWAPRSSPWGPSRNEFAMIVRSFANPVDKYVGDRCERVAYRYECVANGSLWVESGSL